MMERTITVTGRAMVTAPADITVVRTKITGKERTFEAAIARMTDMTVKLKDAAEAAGIPRKDLKTSDLSISQAYRKRRIGTGRDGYDKFEDVPDGFEFTQDVSFEFPNDNDKLSKAIENILKHDITPRIWFDFRTSDPEGLKMKAYSMASEDALRQAEAIIEPLGAKLGKIISINRESPRYYDDDDTRYYEGSKLSFECCSASPISVDVEPSDILREQTVKVVWEIEY